MFDDMLCTCCWVGKGKRSVDDDSLAFYIVGFSSRGGPRHGDPFGGGGFFDNDPFFSGGFGHGVGGGFPSMMGGGGLDMLMGGPPMMGGGGGGGSFFSSSSSSSSSFGGGGFGTSKSVSSSTRIVNGRPETVTVTRIQDQNVSME